LFVDNSDKVYIGSTFKNYISERLTAHRYDYNKYKYGKKNYITSFILFDLNKNVKIIELQRHHKITKSELKKYEHEEIINHKTAVNCYMPSSICSNGNKKEWTKEYNKKYRISNKDKIIEYKKEYYDNNKDKINEKISKKYTCQICGGRYTHNHKTNHVKTTKHKLALNNPKSNDSDSDESLISENEYLSDDSILSD
jgi:hypothetical protein